jgi:hypothetical protein
MSLETKRDNNIELEIQLGDVIKITNPVNENLDGQIFFIDYIDNSKVYLINTDTLNRIKVKIQDDGTLGDGNITAIEILRRADSPSYAKQNGLFPGKWINIHFGGDFPVIITGEITNLEEDMIEIKTTDNDMIYINFDYIGIPEDLPIDNIEIREKPSTPLKQTEEVFEEKNYMPELEQEKKVLDADKIEFLVPTKDVKEQLREIIVQADKIVFGDEDLGYIKEFVDVSSKFKRYSIEEQVSDLLDDILSTIPNSQRTPKVLNNIHIMIERFKQLRNKFSLFDNYGNVESILKKEATYKPLKIWLQNFNKNLFWILPVVKNIKKVYNVENNVEENNDVTNIDLEIEIKDINKIIDNYQTEDLPVESNKYTGFYSELSKHFIPFKYINDENANGIIIEKEINDDLNVVIDNLEDFYSSVYSNNMLRNRRFLISKYNIGQSKLDITDSTSARMTTVRVKITNNDILSIKSIMTLPEPTIRFSKINLPGTDILTRANLNQIFLNYWELLKKKTNVANVFVDTFDRELELNENEFVNGIRNYIMNVPEDEIKGFDKKEIYSKYVNSVVPKTKIIFNLMKKYINGKLSIIDIIGYLEPFLIYTDDLTFKQYEEIVHFIDVKISDYNKNMIELSKIFKMLSNIKQMPIIKTKAFSVISVINSKLIDDVFDTGYQLQNPEETFTNSEILRKLIIKDYTRLYTTTIAYDNINLMFPKEVSDIFEIEKKNNDDKLKTEDENDKCETIVIAKMYTSLDQLQNDNDILIYFDKKYDKTNYGVMEEDSKKGGYAEQVINLTPENLKVHIIRDQMKKNNLNENDATYIAETLIDGNKKVIDGQYAIFYKGYSENIADESDYYIRQNNKWVLDKTMSKNFGTTDEPSIICNLQEKCISVPKPTNDKCESMKTSELSLQNALLTDIISEFDTKYKLSKEQFEKEIKEQFEYFMSIMPVISKIETNFLLKYNNQRYRLGVEIGDDFKGVVVSPFSQILDIILSQKDMVKKQTDIIKFVDKFTRPGLIANSSINETQHWLYCIKTGVPLLPIFKKELASAFMKSPYQYQYTLEMLKSTIGQLSDDGDWWTDKYTGWPICPGDFDYEEGFDEGGFKISSRAIIEEDVGNKIMAATTEQKIQYITPETIMINNVINALSVAMGINIEFQKEFIINSVIDTLKNTVESESDYKEKIKIAKKQMASYKDFFNTSLLYYTLGMFLIAIQTSIPSVKTRKTHPGCVRSFLGYPFEGTGDFSSLTYLSCVTYDIRGPGEPWNVLVKTNVEKIQTRIKAFIDTYLIQLPNVQRKFVEKTEYLLNNPNNEIPKEHDITNWSNFLPPLVPFKIKHLVNISEEFKKSLVNDLKNGLEKQREKILVVESKIIQFSLAIQEKIQDIIKNSKVLLHTSNNEPYLENACCDSKEEQTVIDYFTNLSPDIIQFNNIVKKLTNMLDDIRTNTESVIFYSNINTKNVYPSVSTKFDEKTIYIAFIFYCKFKSLLPIPGDLLPICTDKPDSSLINPTDTIDKIIQKLKDDGRNYTNDQFLRLIQLISRENMINIDLDNPVISSVAKLSKLLAAIYDENNEDEIIEQSLRNLITNAIDTFDIAREEYSIEVKKLNDFLIRSNEEMTNEIIDYVKLNTSSNTTRSSLKSFVKTIENLSRWVNDDSTRNEQNKISNEQMYNVNNFYKNYINNFINVFPNIILNKVNYDNTNIPSYYGFSKNHSNKLKKYISSYFEKLKPFFGIPSITKLLITIQKNGKNILKLAECTPGFSSIKNDQKILRGIIDERTSRFLFEYYLLRILISYIDLADDKNIIVTEVRKDLEVTDIFSVDYIEETETRIDLSLTSRNVKDITLHTGNQKELKQKNADLLIAFMSIFSDEKDLINVSYEEIQDRVFKLKEKEKDMVTDRLKAMTDEQRETDTILKITKQGIYSKGLQKGLTMYDKDFYEDEQNLREEMEKAERKIRKKNKDVTDENINLFVDEYLEQRAIDRDIDQDAYDISGLGETYFDGGFDGVGAPEEEYEDYEQEY